MHPERRCILDPVCELVWLTTVDQAGLNQKLTFGLAIGASEPVRKQIELLCWICRVGPMAKPAIT
jgi:hypothetical protein